MEAREDNQSKLVACSCTNTKAEEAHGDLNPVKIMPFRDLRAMWRFGACARAKRREQCQYTLAPVHHGTEFTSTVPNEYSFWP